MEHALGAASPVLDARATAALLSYPALADEIALLLRDSTVQVPARLVQPLPGGGSLFVMPALDADVAITKLISFTPANAGTGRATIQGDVVVFDVATGTRRLVLDGPTVTARRTAAVSLLAARLLASLAAGPAPGPLLIVGAGVQGLAHLEAFAQGLGVRECMVASRSADSAQALVEHARTLGLKAQAVDDANGAMAKCPLIVTCTPAHGVVLSSAPRDDAFIAAVGAFTPRMVEIDPELCRQVAGRGKVVVDTADAQHEAGDLLQAGLDVAAFPTLADVVRTLPATSIHRNGPVLFKSCGWAGWDLAAARLAVRSHRCAWLASSPQRCAT